MSTTNPKSAARIASTKASRQRRTTIETPLSLIDAILDTPAGDLAGMEAALYAAIHTGGIVEGDYPRHLYAPGLKSVADLPPALLDAKEELAPLKLVPDSSRALDTLLRRLVLIGGIENDPSLALVTAGWPTVPSAMSAWLHHVMRIWEWHRRDPGIYTALVTGRFAPVIRRLRQLVADGEGSGAAALRRDLHVQALIWCAHDVQMVVARLAIGNREFGPLVTSTQRVLSPEGLRTRLADRRTILESILDLLYASPEWRERDLPLPDLAGSSDDAITRDPLVKALARRIELRAQAKGTTIDGVAAELATRLAVVALRLRENRPALAVSLPITDEEKKQRSLAAVRYGGLSSVAAAVVPILRLVQVERQMPMPMLIDELAHTALGVRPEPRDGTALPPYDEAVFPHGWRVRASRLLKSYRPLLSDPFHKAGSTAWPAINAARDFLKAREQRLIGDHDGDRHDPRRTLYLLDVLPEHRFAAGSIEAFASSAKRNSRFF